MLTWRRIVVLLLAPIAAIIAAIVALVILLDSGKPLLYRQERVGYKRKPFMILKFRTMKWDPSEPFAPCRSQNDKRLTRTGGVLRLLKVDELPQLINVWRGEMAFTGPRPHEVSETQEHHERLAHYHLRWQRLPGIWSWHKIRARLGKRPPEGYTMRELALEAEAFQAHQDPQQPTR